MKLSLNNFRNFKKKTIELDQFPLFIFGSNGSGKTSILEAIYYLSTSKSFRTNKKNNLIEFNSSTAALGLDFNKFKLQIKLDKKENNIYFFNQKKVPRYKFINQFLTQIFWWGDFKLAYGEPSERRKFLNLLGLQISAKHLQYLSLYKKILAERSFALKKRDLDLLDIWDRKISVVAENIYFIRKKTLELLNKDLIDNLGKIKKDFSNPKVLYRGEFLNKNNFYNKLLRSRKNDLIDLKTRFGPHRDDLEFCWQNESLANFSQGEVKSYLLSLCFNFLFNLGDKQKYFLIDDVLAEIDPKVISQLINLSCQKNISLILTHQKKPGFKFSGKIIKV